MVGSLDLGYTYEYRVSQGSMLEGGSLMTQALYSVCLPRTLKYRTYVPNWRACSQKKIFFFFQMVFATIL